MKKEQYFCDVCGKELKTEEYGFLDKNDSTIRWQFGEIKMSWVAISGLINKNIDHICKTCIGEIWNKIMKLKDKGAK